MIDIDGMRINIIIITICRPTCYYSNVLWVSGTVLHVAARENSTRCTEAILSHSHCPSGETVRIEVDALATEHRQTPLMTAALHGHVDMMRLLVAAGADINQQTSSCSTALIVACHYGHVDCVHALLGQALTISSSAFYMVARKLTQSFVRLNFTKY